MEPWQIAVGEVGIVVANLLLINVRLYAKDAGLKVKWWSRSLARERELLRKLARSDDRRVARRASYYLRVEIVGWAVAILSIALFFWGVAIR
jgi:hypothetical protein